MDPKIPSQPPSQTPYLDKLLEEKRQMQLARARKMLRKYKNENNSIPGKRHTKNTRGSGQETPDVQDCQNSKGCEESDLLGAKVALLQEKLVDLRSKMKEEDQQALTLHQEQLKNVHLLQQCMAQFEEHLATQNWELTAQNKELKQQVLLQKQHLKQLQKEKEKAQAKIRHLKKQLCETQGLLKTTEEQKQELQAKLNVIKSKEVVNTEGDKQWASVVELMKEKEEVVVKTSGTEAKVELKEMVDIDLKAPQKEPSGKCQELNWAEQLLVADLLTLHADTDTQKDIKESHLAPQEQTRHGWGSFWSNLPFFNGSKNNKETKIFQV